MYYLVFVILLFFSTIEVVTRKKMGVLFDAVYVLMTFMVMFRFGQLADYTSYELIYEYPEMAGITDPLYFMVQDFFKAIGVSYAGFVMLVGALTMGLIYPFLSKYCNKSITALLIFYTYAFLILPMNAFRQGICLAFLLYGFTLILEGKIKKFFVLVGVGSFIHISMLAVMVIPWLYKKQFYNEWYINYYLAGLTLFALVTPDLTMFFPSFFEGRSLGDAEDSRIIQLTIRAMLIVSVLYYNPQYGTLGYYAKAICIIGYSNYCLFAFAPTMSARLEYYFRVFMCVFIAYVIFAEKKSRIREMILLSVIMVHMVLFFKNMNSFIYQGEYDPDKVTMFNFPYVSIFNQEDLKNYKDL